MTHTIHRDGTATARTRRPGPPGPSSCCAPSSRVAPIVFGLDKFFGLLTDWEGYLAPWINDLVPGSAHDAMLAVGVVEIVAGLAVAVARASAGCSWPPGWPGSSSTCSPRASTTTSRCATPACSWPPCP